MKDLFELLRPILQTRRHCDYALISPDFKPQLRGSLASLELDIRRLWQSFGPLGAPRDTNMITRKEFKVLLPLACAWAEEQERIILRDGVALSPAQTTDAKSIGVAHPEKVRLLKVTRIPMPENPALRDAVDAIQLISPRTGGLTLRYGIFIRADCWDDRRLVLHEFVHTSQYERLGGFQQFLQQYLYECITIGYPAAPMEHEAVATTARLCA